MTNESKVKIQDQRFKVTLTMTGISVEQAAKAVADYLPAGQASEVDGQTCVVTDHLERTWLISVDDSLPEERCALSTPLLSYEDTDDFLCMVDELRQQGAQGGDGCGMRLFASLEGHLPRALVNLQGILASKTPMLWKALLATEGSCGKAAPVKVDDENTAEIFPFDVATDLDESEMRTCIQLGCAIAAQAINQNRVGSGTVRHDNERYAFRCWMLRMGLIGDEYKACRMRLLKRLTGDSSFSGGRKSA